MYPLEIDHVTKRYGHEVVVDDLTFTVAPGRVTGFLGPNGAGKSTTMKILLDLASADSGHATIARHPVPRPGGPRHGPSEWSSSRTRSTLDAAAATTCGSSPTAPASPRRASTSCSRWSSSRTLPTATSAATPSGCASGSDWRPRCSATRRSWSSTNPATDSTRRASGGSVTCCGHVPRPAARSSSPAICWPRWSTWPTRWS